MATTLGVAKNLKVYQALGLVLLASTEMYERCTVPWSVVFRGARPTVPFGVAVLLRAATACPDRLDCAAISMG